MSEATAFPASVERYLRAFLVQRTRPLLLSFGADWRLREHHGDAAAYGFDVEGDDADIGELRNLFTGLSTADDHEFAFVELASGRSAHVHLIADRDGFHVLLLDAEEDRGRQRVQQQLSHEAILAGHEKSKALEKFREIRAELEQQRDRLEEANALKNALIATLSHEFRTPLTSIFGYLHLLENRARDSDTAHQALNAVRRNATYLFTLAENLLEYGRGESGAALLDPVRLDLDALGRDIDAMFRPLAEDKSLGFRIDVSADPSEPALFDELRVRQIVVNLLSNAVRYTAYGEIVARFAWRDGVLDIDIVDTGIGISEQYRDTIFRPFNRGAQSGSRGAGLGLSIVRRLVEQMRGEITLESTPGRGSRFLIRLPPLARGAGAMRAAPSRAAPWMSGRSVLVVDDDPDIAQLLEALLLDLGFRVSILADATSAIEAALREPPDILLIDVELPGLSGNAAVFSLRSRGFSGRIVSLSATATVGARDASLRAGADHYLTKPLNVEQFVSVMQRAAQAD